MITTFETVNYFLIVIVGISFVSAETTLDTMLEPICQANCLDSFKDSMKNMKNSEKILKNPFLIQSFCLKHSICKGCVMGCDNPKQSLENCVNYCKTIAGKYEKSCLSSCDFVNELKINRPGSCPEVTRKSQCFYPCSVDSDCLKQGTKCCRSRLCNSTCQIAGFPQRDVPPIPTHPTVRQIMNEKNPDQIQFDLDWSNYDISSVDYPVLFVVQIRIGHLNEASNTVFDRWRNLISTSKSGVIISAIDLETWYQFRLLAFSKFGFRGVGEMTLPITVHYKPTNPVSPKNVSEKVTRIINGKISVTLVWQPGDSNSLLPLTNYKISWKRVYELNENNPLVTEYETHVPASETQYTIENLLPSASYMVKIVSIVVYKDERYNSSAVVYYISTASIPQEKYLQDKLTVIRADDRRDIKCPCEYPNIPLPVDIDNSTTINGQLAMHIKLKDGVEFDNIFAPYSFQIQWQPLACIETQLNSNVYPSSDEIQTIVTKNHIDHYLIGLRFHCNYRIEIELFSQQARKKIKIWDGCFCTPTCSDHFSSTAKVQSICPNTEQHIPSAIKQLKVNLVKVTNKSVTDAELHWRSDNKFPITAFRITWGPVLEEPIDESMYGENFMPLLDSGRALSKVVNYPIHKCILKDLYVGKIYIVKLQAIDDFSASRESSIFFKIHSNINSSSNERFQNYLLLILSIFIVFFII